jgi:hypothetical protein
LLLLVADQPEQARQQTNEVMRRWWSGGFTRQHYSHMLGCGYAALYRGDGEAAWQVPWSTGFALLLRSAVAYHDGHAGLAEQHLAAPPMPSSAPR